MRDDEVIDALGGATALARRLGTVSPQGVSNWKARGIPAQWRPAILAVARLEKVALDEDAFLRVPALKPARPVEHGNPQVFGGSNARTLAYGERGSSRSVSGDFPAEREHSGDCIQPRGPGADRFPSEAVPSVVGVPERPAERGEFHEIEPPTLKQAVFETGLREALDQPTHEGRLAALDTLERQVRRRLA